MFTLFSLSCIEIGVYALHDPESLTKLLTVAGHLLIDTAVSVASLKLAPALLSDAMNLAKTSADMIKQRNALNVFHTLAYLEHQKEYIIQSATAAVDDGFAVLSILANLEKLVKKDRRWEIAAAFTDVLAGLILDDRVRSMVLNSNDFAMKIIMGDPATNFGGLRALASTGDPPKLRENMAGANMIQTALRNWAGEFCESIKKGALSEDTLQNGIEMLVSELNTFSEVCKEKIRVAADPTMQFSRAIQEICISLIMSTNGIEKLTEILKNVQNDLDAQKIRKLSLAIQGNLRKYVDKLEQAQPLLSTIKNVLEALKTSLGTSKELVSCVRRVLEVIARLGGDSFVQEHSKKLDHYGQTVLEIWESLVGSLEICTKIKVEDRVAKVLNSLTVRKAEQELGRLAGEDLAKELEEQLGKVAFDVFPGHEKLEALFSSFSALEAASRVWEALPKRRLASNNKAKFVGNQSVDLKGSSKSKLSCLISSIQSAVSQHDHMVECFVSFVRALPKHSIGKEKFSDLKNALSERCKTLDSSRSEALSKLLNLLKSDIRGVVQLACEMPKTPAFSCATLTSALVDKVCADKQADNIRAVCLIEGRLSELESLLEEMCEGMDLGSQIVDKVMVCLRQLPAASVNTQWAKVSDLLDEDPPQYSKASAAIGSMNGFPPPESLQKDLENLLSDMHDIFPRFSRLNLLLSELASSVRRKDDPSISDVKLELDKIAIDLQKEFSEGTDCQNCEASKIKDEVTPIIKEICINVNERMVQSVEFAKDVMRQQLQNILDGFGTDVKQAKGQVDDFFSLEPDALSTAIKSTTRLIDSVTSFGASQKDVWKVRERTLYNVLRMFNALKNNAPAEGSDIFMHSRVLAELQKIIAERRALETKSEAMMLYSCTTFFNNLRETLAKGLETNAERIEKDLNDRLSTMSTLSSQVETEKDHDKKQLAVIALRKEQAALTSIMGNVTEISQGFKVMTSFLSQMCNQLAAIDVKLDTLAAEVRLMRGDIQRLAGLPVEKVLERYRQGLLVRGQNIPRRVYVPLLCAPDRSSAVKDPKLDKREKVAGETDETNGRTDKAPPPQTILVERVRQFLNNEGRSSNKLDPKGLLLISGLAGSGKTVCAEKIEELILGKHYEERQENGKTVVLVWANLPQLKRPITGLFEEALSLRYHLRDNQIHELRGLLQQPDSKYEAVFVLEAYDELRPEYRFKNLFKTNNLDSYRPQVIKTEPGSATSDTQANKAALEKADELRKAKRNPAFAQPKVIVLCRKELFTNVQGYERSFVPLESLNEEKDDYHEALNYFEEVEIATFDEKNRLSYFQLHVALKVRQIFEKHFFAVMPLPPDCPSQNELDSLRSQLDTLEVEEKSSTIDQLCSLARSLSAPFSFGEPAFTWVGITSFMKEQLESFQDDATDDRLLMFRLMAFLLYGTSPSAQVSDLKAGMSAFLKDIVDHGIWTCAQLVSAFDEIKELKDITTTPFMVEIMVNVLPLLKDLQSNPTSIKQELILLTSEEHAEICWALLREQGMMSDEQLKKIQKYLQQENEPVTGADEVEYYSSDDEYGQSEPETEAQSEQDEESAEQSEDEEPDAKLERDKDSEDFEDDREEQVEITLKPREVEPAAKATDDDSDNHAIANFGDDWGVDDDTTDDSQDENDEDDGSSENHESQVSGNHSADIEDSIMTVAKNCASKLIKGNLSEAYLAIQLRRALRRKPVRRSLVYEVFMDHLMQNKVDKARETSGSAMTRDQILREAMDYSCRLACQMTCEGLTQVAYVPRSQVLQGVVSDEWFAFFGTGDQHMADRAALREVSPLKQSGGIYSFLHKSVQEYLVAKILNDSLCRAVEETGIPKHELLNLVMEMSSHNLEESEDPPNASGSSYGTPMRPNLHMQHSPGMARSFMVVISADKRRKHRIVEKLFETLAASPWQSIELDGEEAIRDFLVDMQLDSTNACAALHIAATLCMAFPIGLQQLHENIKSLLEKPLPKRSGGTLLHAAAEEGVHKVLELAKEQFVDSLTLRNNAGKTALALAMVNQDPLACQTLLKACQALVQDCESFPVRLSLHDRDSDFNYDILSAEIAAIKSGKAFFEITLDLQKLKVKPVYAAKTPEGSDICSRHRFGGQICVGFAGGIAPKRQSVEEVYKLDISDRRLKEYEQYLKEYVQRLQEFVSHKAKKETTENEHTEHQKSLSDTPEDHEKLNFQKELDKYYEQLAEILSLWGPDGDDSDVVEIVAKVRKCMTDMSVNVKKQFWKEEISYAQKSDDKKGGSKKPLKDVQTMYEVFVKQRLERCPVGNLAAPGSATYPKFYGIALLVIERFGIPGELELYCKKLNLGEDDCEYDGLDEDAFPVDPEMLVRLFEAADDPDRAKTSADREDECPGPKPLVVDVNVKQDKVILTLAIDFLHEEGSAKISCCWSQGESQGRLMPIHTIAIDEEDTEPVFPVVAFWNISKSSLIQANFGNRLSVIKPPDGFKPLISLVPGRPAVFVASINKCWDIAKHLLDQSDGQELADSDGLGWIDSYSGHTVLHHFVEKDDYNAVENLIKLCSDDSEELEKVLLSKNKVGVSAFGYVKSNKVAKLLIDTATSLGGWTRSLMLKDWIKGSEKNEGMSLQKSNGIFHEQLKCLNFWEIEEIGSMMIEMAVVDRKIVKMLSKTKQEMEEEEQNLQNLRDAVFRTVLWKEGKVFKSLDDSQKCDIDLVTLAVQSSFKTLKYTTDSLKRDSKEMLLLLQLRGMALKYVDQSLQQDRDIVLAAVRNHGEALRFAYTALRRDREVVMAAVSCHGRALRFASDEMRDDVEVVRTAVTRDPTAFEFVSKILGDNSELVMQVVCTDGLMLCYASARLQADRAIVEAAVRKDGMALQYATVGLRSDEDIVKVAVAANPMALLFSHQKFRRDTNLVLQLARLNPCILRFAIQDDEAAVLMLKDIDRILVQAYSVQGWMEFLEWCSEDGEFQQGVYKAILAFDGTLLKQLPEEVQQQRDLVQLALENSQGRALQHADDSMRGDEELALQAVKMDPANLAFVDPKMDREAYLRICEVAITASPAALAHVDRKILLDTDPWMTQSLGLEAVLSKDGTALEYMPENRHVEFAMSAVTSRGKALRFVSSGVRKQIPDVIEIAIRNDGAALEYINFKTTGIDRFKELASLALQTDGRALQFIPEDLRKDFVECAIERDGSALEFAPPESRVNRDYALRALRSSGSALPFVPSYLLQEDEFKALLPDILSKDGMLLRHVRVNQENYQELATLAIKQKFAALEFAHCSFADGKLAEIIRSQRSYAFDNWLGLSPSEAVSGASKANSGQGELDFRGTFSTVTCPNLTVLRGNRFYYEVEILEISPSSAVQFGFADHSFNPSELSWQGVGDDSHSWSVDGLQHLAWHGASSFAWPTERIKSHAEVDAEKDAGASQDSAISKDFAGAAGESEEIDGRDVVNVASSGSGTDESPQEFSKEIDARKDESPENDRNGSGEGTENAGDSGGDGHLHLRRNGDSDGADDECESDSELEEPDEDIIQADWEAGDVVGLACDPANELIAASLNGEFFSRDRSIGQRAVFRGFCFRGPGLYPALSGRSVRVRYNFGPQFGGQPFRCPPPPWVNMEEWSRLGEGFWAMVERLTDHSGADG